VAHQAADLIVDIPYVFLVHLVLTHNSVSASIFPQVSHHVPHLTLLLSLGFTRDLDRDPVELAETRKESLGVPVLKNVSLKVLIAGQSFDDRQSLQELVNVVKSLVELYLVLVRRTLL
jgi:hypothetical protein